MNILIGLNNIFAYFCKGVFKKIFSMIHEVSENDIDTNLNNAWRQAFNEDPPII